MKSFRLLLIFLFLSAQFVNAQNALTTKKISVFKNGTAFYQKSGSVNATDGKYYLKETPEALFGTMWIGAAKGDIKSVRSIQEKTTTDKEATSIKEMLQGNIGKKVHLTTYNNESYDGEVVSVQESIVHFKTKEKWISTQPSNIKTIEFIDAPSLSYPEQTDKNKIVVEFGASGTKQLEMIYLQKNLGWFPHYLIELKDDKNAVITLKSTLVNDSEDIENAEVDFVVGVPNFKYNYLLAPTCSPSKLNEITGTLNGSYSYLPVNNFDNNFLSNGIMSQQMAPMGNGGANMDYSFSNEFSSLDVSSQEDLYFYSHKNISLKKGERADYEIFSTKIPFEHIYEVTIVENYTAYNYYKSDYDNANQNKVWHSIKLTNGTEYPWTTGTAMVVKDENGLSKPISQDMLTYTPSKGNNYLKITVSPDISVKDKDIEVKRQEKVKKKDSYFYDLVTVESTLTLKNYKDKEIKLSINRIINGELQESNVDWKHTRIFRDYYYNYINSANDVNWELQLKPGEEKEIKYSYTVYVNN